MSRMLLRGSNTIQLIITLFILCVSSAVHGANTTREYYVSPSGSDMNDGSEKMPFKTIGKARDAARISASNASRSIILREGSYYETEFVLEAADSGLTLKAYPGERDSLCRSTVHKC